MKKKEQLRPGKLLSPPCLLARETESFTSWLCCCLQFRQCNMTRKLIMLAPQAHSQCPFAMHICLYTLWNACQPCPDKMKIGLTRKTHPTALLQVRMQSNQPVPIFFPSPPTSFLPPVNHSHHSREMPKHRQIWLNSVRIKLTWSHTQEPSRLSFLYTVFHPKTFLLPGPVCSTVVTF